VSKKRIILAADTRTDAPTPGVLTYSRKVQDDACKIIRLGPMAVAVSGYTSYTRNSEADPLPEWDSLTDAKTTFATEPQDSHALAQGWAKITVSHFQRLYQAGPIQFIQLANINHGLLAIALIAGWKDGSPIVYEEVVYFEDHGLQLVPIRFQEKLHSEPAYTTHLVTQELIDGNTERAKATSADSRSNLSKIKRTDRDWRWVEFLISSTNRYAEDVGKDADVLEIPPGRNASWLRNTTCQK
jgi:hypothetical protein